MYELERWQLSAAHTGYLFSYKVTADSDPDPDPDPNPDSKPNHN